MGDTRRIIAFGCSHHPLQDEAAVAALIARVAKYQPHDLVHLGDGLEANAASQWDDAKELAIDLDAEYAAHNAFLADLRKAAPKARRIYRAGNHEDNIVRAGRLDKRIRKTCDWKSLANQPELAHWEVAAAYSYSRHLGCTQLGPIFLAHGWETTPSAMPKQAMYFTKNWPFGLLLTAHTHRPQRVTEVRFANDLPLNRYFADVGCLRDLNPQYMERKRKWAWGHGYFVGEYNDLKSPRMAQEWDGEIEVLRLYDDRAAA